MVLPFSWSILEKGKTEFQKESTYNLTREVVRVILFKSSKEYEVGAITVPEEFCVPLK